MIKKNKVYCENCKYFYRSGGIVPSHCKHKVCEKIIDTPITREQYNKTPKDKDYPNKYNCCFYYKRKWWKFWI